MAEPLTCTIEDVLAWGPCDDYDAYRLAELFGRQKRLSAIQILDLDIPTCDRLWAVLRGELVPEKLLREFAHQCAAHNLHLVEKCDL